MLLSAFLHLAPVRMGKTVSPSSLISPFKMLLFLFLAYSQKLFLKFSFFHLDFLQIHSIMCLAKFINTELYVYFYLTKRRFL